MFNILGIKAQTSRSNVNISKGVSAKFGTLPITGSTPYSVKLKVDFRKLPEASAGNCLCLLAKTFLIYLLEWQSSGGPQSRILGALSKSNYLLIVIADEIVFTAPIG